MHPLRLTSCRDEPGEHYNTPKELWAFRTPPRREPPTAVARAFLIANADRLGIVGLKLGKDLRRVRAFASLGAHHVLYRQYLEAIPIHRAYVTVHLSRQREVYLVKNRAVSLRWARPAADFALAAQAAEWIARESVGPERGDLRVLKSERDWFPLGHFVRPAYRVRLLRREPREDWIVYVDAARGRVLRKYDNLSSATGVGLVFDPNPVAHLRGTSWMQGDWETPPPLAAYRQVALRDLRANGKLDGRRVSTRLTQKRIKIPARQFLFCSRHPAFEEVMAYFHIDEAVRYLESLGYKGRRAIFKKPIPVDANGTQADNSWYSPHDRSLTFGLGDVDDAEDAEVILHELGHAIQDAICPDFGQKPQAAAMGEGFGDYFAASFFADRKPKAYRPCFGMWDGVVYGNNPPCVRRLDAPVTATAFDEDGDEHDNGAIWAAVLWDVWKALGRRVADTIIIESHFELDAFTTFARGARGIIHADQNLFDGRHVGRLRRVFARRRIKND